MTTWSRIQTENLIKLHQEYNNLYNCKDAEYKNRIKRIKSLEEIAKRMRECRPGTTVKEVQLKLKTLRTQYLKEKNTMRQSRNSDCGTEEVYIPKLWCYNELQHMGDINDDIVEEKNKMSTWSRIQTENLMKLHQEYTDLYNCKDTEYKNRINWITSLEEIAKRMEECRPGTTVKEMLLKLQTLRTQHLKEENTMRQSRISGCVTEEVYIPNNLSDINDYIVGESNIPFLSHTSPTESIDDSCDDSQAATSFVKTTTKSSLVDKVNVALSSAMTLLEQIKSKKVSSLRTYLDNLEVELGELNPDLLARGKWKITNIVHELQEQQRSMNALASSVNITFTDSIVSSESEEEQSYSDAKNIQNVFDEDDLQ